MYIVQRIVQIQKIGYINLVTWLNENQATMSGLAQVSTNASIKNKQMSVSLDQCKIAIYATFINYQAGYYNGMKILYRSVPDM